ncbi:hypothetical protein ACVWXO_004352 [Bradyrhizobium sp. LM2.7]
MSERYPDNERHRPHGTTYPPCCYAALYAWRRSRMIQTQEGDSDEDQQGLENEVHFTEPETRRAQRIACEHCELSNRTRDRIQGERKDQIGLRVVDLPKASRRGQAEVQGRRPFVYLNGQSRTGQQTNKERAGANSIAPRRPHRGHSDDDAPDSSVNCKRDVRSPLSSCSVDQERRYLIDAAIPSTAKMKMAR